MQLPDLLDLRALNYFTVDKKICLCRWMPQWYSSGEKVLALFGVFPR
jgi:hypothetical protein